MAIRKILKRGQIVEIEDPNIDTTEEASARHSREKKEHEDRETRHRDLVKYLQKVVDGKETLDHAKLASAVLLALGYESESQASEFAKNKI